MPMAGEFCLDTNIAVAFLNGHPEVIARVGTASRVALPSPTVGELLFGAKKSRRREANLRRFRAFIQACEVIEIDEDVAELYADFKLQLKENGTPIPENDVWIAACAQSSGLRLVTDDQHFGRIPCFATDNCLIPS